MEKKLIGRPKGIPASKETKAKISKAIKKLWAEQKKRLKGGKK